MEIVVTFDTVFFIMVFTAYMFGYLASYLWVYGLIMYISIKTTISDFISELDVLMSFMMENLENVPDEDINRLAVIDLEKIIKFTKYAERCMAVGNTFRFKKLSLQRIKLIENRFKSRIDEIQRSSL
jgi:hypothetical protein